MTLFGALEQAVFFQKHSERLAQVVSDGAVGQAKHGGVQLLLEHLVERRALNGQCETVNALQVFDGASATDSIMWYSFAVQMQFNIIQTFFGEHMHMTPAQVLRFCAMPLSKRAAASMSKSAGIVTRHRSPSSMVITAGRDSGAGCMTSGEA